jgi:hypothetical protein
MYNLVIFSVFTIVYLIPVSILKYFHHSKKKHLTY